MEAWIDVTQDRIHDATSNILGEDGDGLAVNVLVDDQQYIEIVPAENSVPPTTPPYSNGADHFAGPRKQESGDTGSIMTVEDYGKFLDFLCRGGVTEDGQFSLDTVSCVGCCGQSPVITVDEDIYGYVNQTMVQDVLGKYT